MPLLLIYEMATAVLLPAVLGVLGGLVGIANRSQRRVESPQIGDRFEQDEWHVLTHDGGGLKHALVLRRKTVDPGGEKRLYKAVKEIIEKYDPPAVFVYQTCVPAMIGDEDTWADTASKAYCSRGRAHAIGYLQGALRAIGGNGRG